MHQSIGICVDDCSAYIHILGLNTFSFNSLDKEERGKEGRIQETFPKFTIISSTHHTIPTCMYTTIPAERTQQ